MYKKLSVLIPIYNEKDTIKTCVESVLKADIKVPSSKLSISPPTGNPWASFEIFTLVSRKLS